MHVETNAHGSRLVEDSIEKSVLVVELNRFLAAQATRGLSPATIRAYAYDLLTLCRWLNRTDKNVYELRQADLLGYIDHQKQLNAHPNSINRSLITIRLFHRFLTGAEMEAGPRSIRPGGHYRGRGMDKNLGIHSMKRRRHINLRIKTPQTLIEPLTRDEVCAFLSSLRRYRDIAIIHLMLLCGLRSQEILTLRVQDIDFVDSRMRVLGKGQKERILPLPQILLSSVGDYLKLERPTSCAGNHLFAILQGCRRGRPMTPAGLRSLFRYRREKVGIPAANAHRFRHTFGADMARNGVRLPILQRMMGHASGMTTLRYINLSMSDITREYQRAIAAIRKKYESSVGKHKLSEIF